jgi:DNA primase
LIAQQCGLSHFVAVLGTALGPKHLQVLRRFADRVILVLDGDEAGRRRTNEILELFLSAQMELRVLTLPEGQDPADFILDRGPEAFQQLLDAAPDALEHKVRVATTNIDLAKDTHRANLALDDVLTTIAKSPHYEPGQAGVSKLREEQVLVRLARTFAVPEPQLRARLTDLRRQPGFQRKRAPVTPRPEQAAPVRLRDLDPCETELLEILILHPEFGAEAIREIEFTQLKSEPARSVLATIQRLHAAGQTPDFGNVLTALEESYLKNIWVELDERAQAKADEAQLAPRERFEGLIEHFRFTMMSKERQQKQAALEQNHLSEEEALAELQSLIAQERNRHGISGPTDG